MKRWKRILAGMIAFITCIVAITGGCPIGTIRAYAEETTADGLKYSVNNDGTITITGYDGKDTEIVIPEEIEGHRVTSIGNYAFAYCFSLTGIELPDGVTSIGNNAFCYCWSLASLEIPDSVTNIGDYAFYYCSSLTGIELPDGVTSVGTGVFEVCNSLISIGLPDGLMSIGERSFYDCSSLTSIKLPNGLTSIEYQAFEDCSNLTSIELPNGIMSIGERSFYDCSSLTSIELPDGLTSIGYRAFEDCSSLTSIELPDGATNIGEMAFRNCSSLISIELPDGVTSIGDWIFYGCRSLASIELPDGVTSIGERAFEDCSSLTGIKLPDGLTSIGGRAFRNCSSLTSIDLPDGVTSIGYGAFEDCRSLTGIDLPDGVTSIENGAFKDCSSLTNIDLPDGVTSIGYEVFAYCSSLTGIALPDRITSIGERSFYDCSSLTSIELPDGLMSIEYRAFEDCSSLTSIELPDSVTSIRSNAFICCDSLTIYCNSGSYAHEYAVDNGIKYYLIDQHENDYITTADEITVGVGKEYLVVANLYRNGILQFSDEPVTWSIDNIFTAHVETNTNSGVYSAVVKGQWPGEANVYVRTQDGMMSKIHVNVVDHTDLSSDNRETTEFSDSVSIPSGSSNYKVTKSQKWEQDHTIKSKVSIASSVGVEGKNVTVKSGGELIVDGKASLMDITVEGGGKVTVLKGGRLSAETITAQGGIFWNGGGCVEVQSGAYVMATNIILKNDAYMNMDTNSQVIVTDTFKIATSVTDSQFNGGDLFIGKHFIQEGNEKNFVASDSHHTIFYEDTDQPIDCKSSKYHFGYIYAANGKVGMEISKNVSASNMKRCYSISMKDKIKMPWTYTVWKKTYDPAGYVDETEWQKAVLESYKKIAGSGAYQVNCSRLTNAQAQAVNKLAALWVASLKMPIYDDMTDVGFKDYSLRIKLTLNDNKTHNAMLACSAWGMGNFSNFNTVYLIIDGDTDNKYTVGFGASGNINSFAEQAGEYVRDQFWDQYMSYVTGVHNEVFGKSMTWDIFSKFLTKIVCQKYVTDGGKSIQDTYNSVSGTISKWVKIIDAGVGLNEKFDDISKKTSARTAEYLASEKTGAINVLKDGAGSFDEGQPLAISGQPSAVAAPVDIKDENLLAALKKQLGTLSDGSLNLADAQNIRSLDLANSYIRDLSGLENFPSLSVLNLQNNEISDIAPLRKLTQITCLDISGNQIADLTPINSFKNLQTLYMQANQISDLTPIVGLDNLQILKASDNLIQTVETISTLTNLKVLQLSGNDLANAASSFNVFGQLESLELAACGMVSVDGLNIPSLKSLDISNNSITAIENIQAEKLEVLYAGNNELKQVDGLAKLASLLELDLHDNKLEDLGALRDHANLQSLDISGNHMTDAGLNGLSGMQSIAYLNVSDNPLFGFKAFLEPANLSEINVSNTQLTDTEKEILEECGLTVTDNSMPISIFSAYYMQDMELNAGEKGFNPLITYPYDADLSDVTYQSGNESVATVNKRGEVKGQNAGKTEISAILQEEVIATYSVTVIDSSGAVPTDAPDTTPTPEVTPTPEPTATPSPQPTATPTPEPTATPSPKPTATPSPEPTATPSPQPTATPSPKPTATPSPKPTVTPTPTPVIYGDINGDGKVGVQDALLILKDVVGSYKMDVMQVEAADVDGDQKITVKDALFILKMVVGSIKSFPIETK